MHSKKKSIILFTVFLSALLLVFLGYYLFFLMPAFKYSPSFIRNEIKQFLPVVAEEVSGAVHVPTPEAVKGIYMTSCVAGAKKWREQLKQLILDTELNSLIIDIKDYSGTITFSSAHPLLKDHEPTRCTVDDLEEYVKSLHDENIYVIARITVFQDPIYAVKFPETAIKKNSGAMWRDNKGLSYVDPGAREFWDYIVAISKESYDMGFDELNYDYIRFPSDGYMRDIYYPFSEETVNNDPDLGKANVIQSFFKYLNENMKDTGAVLSADLFGMAATNADDLNIGQILEYAEPYFDYIAPMVYPSHYPTGFIGISDVNAHPYEIVKYSMDKASDRLINASSTPDKLRPWLQDFNYPVTYTASMVRTQIQAVYDAGLDSWMLWDPKNIYTRGALE
jgi:hypothetical protein